MNTRVIALCLSILVLLGILVRAVDLGTHFGHIDDLGVAKTILVFKQSSPIGIAEMVNRFSEDKPKSSLIQTVSPLLRQMERFEKSNIFLNLVNTLYRVSAVPAMWTYAPFQFLITYALVFPGQTYREIVFWGRFPSFLLGCLGLLAMIWFYWKYERLKSPAVFLSVAFLAFSWENIIFAKQMQSYSIGVCAAIGVLVVLFSMIETNRYTSKGLLICALCLFLLGTTQYQVLYFIPACFLTLFLCAWEKEMQSVRVLMQKFSWAVLTYGVLLLPLYVLFINRHLGRSINYLSRGPSGEYALTLDPTASWLNNLLEAVKFLVKNTFIVLSTNFAFVPEDTLWFTPIAFILFALFLLGAFRLWRSQLFLEKMLGRFFLFSTLTWVILIAMELSALGPSRHCLILLPYMAIGVSLGWNELLSHLSPFRVGHLLRRYGHLAVVVGIALLFFRYFPETIHRRHDPFDETKLEKLLADSRADTVIEYNSTINVGLMRNVTQRYRYFGAYQKHDVNDHTLGIKEPPFYERIAFISHRNKLTPILFETLRDEINKHPFVQQHLQHYLPYRFKDYRVVYRLEIESDVEIEFSKKTVPNGSNNFFFCVLERIPSGTSS